MAEADPLPVPVPAFFDGELVAGLAAAVEPAFVLVSPEAGPAVPGSVFGELCGEPLLQAVSRLSRAAPASSATLRAVGETRCADTVPGRSGAATVRGKVDMSPLLANLRTRPSHLCGARRAPSLLLDASGDRKVRGIADGFRRDRLPMIRP